MIRRLTGSRPRASSHSSAQKEIAPVANRAAVPISISLDWIESRCQKSRRCCSRVPISKMTGKPMPPTITRLQMTRLTGTSPAKRPMLSSLRAKPALQKAETE